MFFNFKELLIIVVLKLLIENFLCNIVGLIKIVSVIVCWCIFFKIDDFYNFMEYCILIKLSMLKV